MALKCILDHLGSTRSRIVTLPFSFMVAYSSLRKEEARVETNVRNGSNADIFNSLKPDDVQFALFASALQGDVYTQFGLLYANASDLLEKNNYN